MIEDSNFRKNFLKYYARIFLLIKKDSKKYPIHYIFLPIFSNAQ